MNHVITPKPKVLSDASLDLAGSRLKDAFSVRPATTLRNQPGPGCSRGTGLFPVSVHRNGGKL